MIFSSNATTVVSTPRPGAATWAEAWNTCDGLTALGYDDWRVPSLGELYTLYYLAGAAQLYAAGWVEYFTRTSDVGNPGLTHAVLYIGGGTNTYWDDGTRLNTSCVR